MTFNYLLFNYLDKREISRNEVGENVRKALYLQMRGPIFGGTFGIVLKYKPLYKVGIINKLIGLAVCVISGINSELFHIEYFLTVRCFNITTKGQS